MWWHFPGEVDDATPVAFEMTAYYEITDFEVLIF